MYESLEVQTCAQAGGQLVSDDTVSTSDIKMDFRISDCEKDLCMNKAGVQFCVDLGYSEDNKGNESRDNDTGVSSMIRPGTYGRDWVL